MPKRDPFADTFGVIASVRYEILAGWFSRHFEPHPLARSPAEERDYSMAQRSGWEVPGERTPEQGRDTHAIDHDLDR